jgi:hypothetical protein
MAAILDNGIKKKSSPLKLLSQSQPNFAEIILRWSPFKIVSGDAMHQPTWPLLLKIEHMVKLQVFGLLLIISEI